MKVSHVPLGMDLIFFVIAHKNITTLWFGLGTYVMIVMHACVVLCLYYYYYVMVDKFVFQMQNTI